MIIHANDGEMVSFTNQYGTFSIKKGYQVCCSPFVDVFNTVISINGHNDPRIITIVDSNNNYDTRNIANVFGVR